MNDQSQMMNRSFGMWPPPLPTTSAPSDDPLGFQNPNRPSMPPPPFVLGSGAGKSSRMNWKAKKAAANKRNNGADSAGMSGHGGRWGGAGGYRPPALNELQFQNRMKARKFYPRKKFPRFAPFAPRNTSSFIIRAKKSGGIASLVSPCPVTPAILPTPRFSPSRDDELLDMEEWGVVDGYGSMKGRIRLRSPDNYEICSIGGEDEDESEESESDVEEHLEVERRLDHDVSRFEMVCPVEEHGLSGNMDLLENRVDDQDAHIAQLEEENLTLKERLFLMESEMAELRRRLILLESCRVESEENHNGNGDNGNNDMEVVDEAIEKDGDADEAGDVLFEKSVVDCEDNVDVQKT